MPRLARIVAVGEPHHITQRGNNRQDVFFVEEDREVYLGFLAEYAARYRLQIHAWCLMTNHVHLVAVPEREESLSEAIGRTHFRYSQYVNAFHGRSGHLWQGRFHSCALDRKAYGYAMRYVEQNPVRARMVRVPWRYRWSSAAVHCGLKEDEGLLRLDLWRAESGGEEAWKEMLLESAGKTFGEALMLNTHTGRPLGTDSFLSKLEHALGRRVRPLPVGRPKKPEPAADKTASPPAKRKRK